MALADIMDSEKVKTGRPTDYSDELTERILDLMTDGMSLVEICEREDMPGRRTVTRWMTQYPSFGSLCAQARQNGADVHTLRLQRIIDKVESGELTPEQARVMSNNLTWLAMKLNPSVYGDKLQTSNDTKITVTVEYGSSPKSLDNVQDAEFTELPD